MLTIDMTDVLNTYFTFIFSRLLLWDCDDRSYRYFVEVSVNNWEWEMVADKTHEECRSWQVLRFPARPVVFIKIVGTHNTANEVSVFFLLAKSAEKLNLLNNNIISPKILKLKTRNLKAASIIERRSN